MKHADKESVLFLGIIFSLKFKFKFFKIISKLQRDLDKVGEAINPIFYLGIRPIFQTQKSRPKTTTDGVSIKVTYIYLLIYAGHY